MTSTLPAGFGDLLDRPLFAHLSTVTPDGAPQSSVMWFGWDGEHILFTHTSTRQKYRNVQAEPRIAFSVVDPENGYRYLEVRGTVVSMEPDENGAAFYQSLMQRYGSVYPVPDADTRVVLKVRPDAFVAGGEPKTEN